VEGVQGGAAREEVRRERGLTVGWRRPFVDDAAPESRLYVMGRLFVLGVSAVGFLVAGCSQQPNCAPGCTAYSPAEFKLACSPNDLTSVVATGPCANPDASLSWYTGTTSELEVDVPSSGPGTCHIVLTFASGFTYSQDVTFAYENPECSCGRYLAATSGPFNVNNPSDTCLPAGR